MNTINKISNNTKFRKVLVIILLISTIILEPVKSFAHNAYFLQVTINRGTYQYEGQVVDDKHRLRDAEIKEKHHMEAELGYFHDIKNFSLGSTGLSSVDFSGSELEEATEEEGEIDADKASDSGTSYHDFNKKSNGVKEMPFTFPSSARKSKFIGVKTKSNNHGSAADQSRAYTIRDTLVPGINEVIGILNDGLPFTSVKDMMLTAENITGSPTTTDTGWNISYEDTKSGKNIVLKKGSESYSFIYEVEKGYRSKKLKSGRFSPVYSNDHKYPNDVETLSMTDLIIQANYSALEKGIFTDSEDNPNQTTIVEKTIAGVLASGVNQLRGLLGLYSLNDLVYNEGVRGPSSIYKGVMPQKWFEMSVAMHLIVQGIVWTILFFAIIKLLFMKNLSTVNPSMRISLIEGFKDIFLAMFLLATNLLIIMAMVEINNKLVGIFAKTVPADASLMDNAQNSYDSLGSVLMQIYYFFITVYFNAIYLYRSLYTTVLVASGPWYISKIAFGGRGKIQFDMWWKELTGNIFLQTYHAFILSMFLGVQKNSRGIVLAVISFALIPLTKQFKALVGGGGGLFSEQTAGAGVGMAAGMGLGLLRNSKYKNNKNADKVLNDSNANNNNNNFEDSGSGDSSVGVSSVQTKGAEHYQNLNKDIHQGSSATTNPTGMSGGVSSNQEFTASDNGGLDGFVSNSQTNSNTNSGPSMDTGFASGGDMSGETSSSNSAMGDSNSTGTATAFAQNPNVDNSNTINNSTSTGSSQGNAPGKIKFRDTNAYKFSKGIAKTAAGTTALAFATMGTMALGSEPQLGRTMGQISKNSMGLIRTGANEIKDTEVIQGGFNTLKDMGRNKIGPNSKKGDTDQFILNMDGDNN